jgi:hypothetical protein
MRDQGENLNGIQVLMRRSQCAPGFDRTDVSGKTLVLRGTPEHALRDWNATRYWAGEIEVRLEDLIRR